MKTALLLIATGEKYWKYIDPLLESARKYLFPHDVILWTDSRKHHLDFHIHKTGEGYPNETLHRYHTFLQEKTLLSRYDFLMYTDIDMLWVAPAKEEDIVSDGIIACLHPGYIGKTGTPERNPLSTSYIPMNATNKYFCGGMNGGKTDSFLKMAEILKKNIDIDAKNGIIPVWHDESAINKFLYDNLPAKILTPSYCYPEDYNGGWGWSPEQYSPVLIALDKRKLR